MKSARHMALEHIQGKIKQAMGNRIKSRLPKATAQGGHMEPDADQAGGPPDGDGDDMLRKLKAAAGG